MSLLSVDDFKGRPMDPNLSAFEALLEVARVASLKLHQEIANSKENVPSNPNPDPNPKERKARGLKRSHATQFDEKDCVFDLEEEKKKSKKKQRQQLPLQLPHEGLPEDLKKKMGEMGGSDVSLLIEKCLYRTDLSPQHNRLSLPLNQIRKPDFLREWESLVLTEKEKKKKKSLDVVFVDPLLRTRSVVLGKWDMSKSSCYMLRSSWMKVANENGLRVNDVVQIWSFRVQQQLCMALVKLTS